MTYRIRRSRALQQAMATLPEAVVGAVVGFVYGPLAENPQRVGKPLHDKFEGQYAARRGSYRIRYRITEEEVIVVAVQHRADAYR